jgi:tetratricopeptide (TPR) repeat protein
VAAAEGFPADKLPGFGRETGFRILPYTKQDRYSRRLTDLEIPAIVLENDFLRAELLPSLGGRLWSLFDKKQGRDMLYRNPVFRPANLAIRDAWFSGGIEWNIGRFGHTVHTCSPVFAGILDETGEAPILRIWEFERQTRLFWRVEFSLAPDAPVLYVYVRVENPDPSDPQAPAGKPLYWWTNAALPQARGTRVLSSGDEALYFVPGTGKLKTMGGARLPDLPTLPGVDASYPVLSDYSNEFFFQCEKAYWESAVHEDGYAYAETSSAPLRYRKMWCWGSGPGGRRWQEYLSLPGEEYLELQAGLAPTQLHTALIAGESALDWVQGFTALNLDPREAHQKSYPAAAAYAGEQIARRIGAADLDRALEAARRRQDRPVDRLLALGSGWGAVERRIRGAPAALDFPAESVGADERPWLELLDKGALPLGSPEEGPGSYMCDAEPWEALLEKSLGRSGDWLTPLHLGVIALERGETAKALSWWEQSLAARENPWAYRNVAAALLREGDAAAALDQYRKLFSRFGDESALDRSFAEEFIPLLIEQGCEEEAAAALDAYATKTGDMLSGPLADALAALAFKRGDDALLDAIFAREPPHIREGNTTLVDLWFAREKLRGSENGTPPREIDFRMFVRQGGK